MLFLCKTGDHMRSHSDPAYDAKPVTPSDVNPLPDGRCEGIYIGGAGDLMVKFHDGGANVPFTAAYNGYHPLSVTQVVATGTTATGIVALYGKLV